MKEPMLESKVALALKETYLLGAARNYVEDATAVNRAGLLISALVYARAFHAFEKAERARKRGRR